MGAAISQQLPGPRGEYLSVPDRQYLAGCSRSLWSRGVQAQRGVKLLVAHGVWLGPGRAEKRPTPGEPVRGAVNAVRSFAAASRAV